MTRKFAAFVAAAALVWQAAALGAPPYGLAGPSYDVIAQSQDGGVGPGGAGPPGQSGGGGAGPGGAGPPGQSGGGGPGTGVGPGGAGPPGLGGGSPAGTGAAPPSANSGGGIHLLHGRDSRGFGTEFGVPGGSQVPDAPQRVGQ